MAAARPLPQFDASDLTNGQLIRKLRQLARTIELAYGNGSTAEAGGAWHVGKGPPAAGLGAYDDLYIDVTDAETHIVWLKSAGGWAELGALASTEGGEANTSRNVGNGVGLALPKKDVDLPFRSLLAGAGISIRESGENVVIAFTDKVDGGYFQDRKDTLRLQFARGQRRKTPTVGGQGEPFLALDTLELFLGTGTAVRPLQIAPENVIGLLDNKRIASKFLPPMTRPKVYAVNNETAMRVIENAAESDIAIVRDTTADGRGSFVFDGRQWLPLNRPVDGLASYVAAEDVPAFAVVAIVGVRNDIDGAVTYTAQAALGVHDLFDQVVGIAPQIGIAGQPMPVQTRGSLTNETWAWTPGAPIYGTAQGTLTEERPENGYLVIGFAVTPTSIRLKRRQELRNIGKGASLAAERDGSVTDIRTLVGDETIHIEVDTAQVLLTIPKLDGAVAPILVKRADADTAITDRELCITRDTRELVIGSADENSEPEARPARVDRDNVIDLGCHRLPAGETLGDHRAVVARNGQWFLADPAAIDDMAAVFGVTVSSGAQSEVVAARFSGLMSHSAWSWELGRPIYYTGYGVLTQEAPADGLPRVIAVPVSATQIAVAAQVVAPPTYPVPMYDARGQFVFDESGKLLTEKDLMP